jgi:hypothetical protein
MVETVPIDHRGRDRDGRGGDHTAGAVFVGAHREGTDDGLRVESLGGQAGDLGFQGGELRRVVALVGRGLGRIGVERGELAHALEDLARDLEDAVLRLEKRDGVRDVHRGGTLTTGGGRQFHRDGETAGIVRGGDNFRAAGEPVQALLQVFVLEAARLLAAKLAATFVLITTDMVVSSLMLNVASVPRS